MRRWLVLLMITSLLAGCTEDAPAGDSDGDGFADEEELAKGSDPRDATSVPKPVDRNRDGIVVVAVVDGGFNPYHLDMVGSMMPQHRNSDPSDDLPLQSPPHEWIPGFPDPTEAFASYTSLELDLSYSLDPQAINESLTSNELIANDVDEWQKVQGGSTADNAHYHYIPGSKVIGYVNTGGGTGVAASSHGVGTSTVSVGNIHGSCPECLLVFVNNGGGEHANNWVMKQSWIDVQTNSYGYSTAVRDRMYAGSDVDAQKEAVLDGQAIFFSAGNGQGNTFTVPNPTLFSSQEGPDWIVTVGAIDPVDYNSYQGHGKPADIASIGSGYPSGGYCDGTINCTGNFGGTSNATPVTAGMYAKALYELRKMATEGRDPETPSIVNGLPCGPAATADCDGSLTAPELLRAMFGAAEHHSTGWVAGITGVSYPVQTAEMQFMSEGHGSFIARLHGDADWSEEWRRVVETALGNVAPEYIEGEVDWFINDSYCRQSIWGTWEGGDYDGTNLPGPDPMWPARNALQASCPTVIKAVVDVEKIRDGGL